jgi:prepilin-type N-terminal cleavage/methylation domain-containing protein
MKSISFFLKKGFTLVEVVVVLAIIVIMTGIIFINYRQAGTQLALQRSTNKLTQDIRRVEEMATSMKEFNGSIPLGGYGIDIGCAANDYTLFADCDGDGIYDPPPSPSCSGSSENILGQNVKLEKGVEISGCTPITIIFAPPDPTVTISTDPSETAIASINLTNTNGQTKTVKINKAGLIWIE